MQYKKKNISLCGGKSWNTLMGQYRHNVWPSNPWFSYGWGMYVCTDGSWGCWEEEIAFVSSLTCAWFKLPPRFVIFILSANSFGGCIKPHWTQEYTYCARSLPLSPPLSFSFSFSLSPSHSLFLSLSHTYTHSITSLSCEATGEGSEGHCC